MGDTGYSGTLPANSWTLATDEMGAHLFERSNVGNRPDLQVFDQSNMPTFYPYGSEANAGQAHLRLHDATAEVGISLRSANNTHLSDIELMQLYTQAYSKPELQNIHGDIRTGNSSTLLGQDVTPQRAFELLKQWGAENSEGFSNVLEQANANNDSDKGC